MKDLITWGQAESIKLPAFDVCWTSPPYENDDLVDRVTERLYRVAKEDSLMWLMYPDTHPVFAGWSLITICTWCMTESDIDKAYHPRAPLECTHDISLWAKGSRSSSYTSPGDYYWNPGHWMPNWIPGGIIDSDAEYLPVPQEVIAECLGASLPSEGKVFLDPFCGTGTSVLTAHEMGFDAHGVEKNEATAKKANMRIRSLEIELPSEKHGSVVL